MRKFTFIKSLFLAVALLAGNAVWGQYTGSGTFSKITSLPELTDGYYVIVNSADAFAMNSTNASGYFENTAISPSASKIINPAVSIVWKIQSHIDGGYTIYSEQSSKYVSYTGSSNTAQAVDNVSGGNQRWNISYGSNLFTFANSAITARILQYNSSSPRFACYTSAQQKLLLYKMEAASTTQVAAPTFTPAAGNYFSTQNVSISTTTEGATIRYTTNGDEPTETSTEYTTPISVSSTTTIKAKAFKTGMDASSVASATYTFPVEVANIGALRLQTTGTTVYKLTGEAILTLKSATRNVKYIQDATGGILIDDDNGLITTTYNTGDGITGIVGTINLFNGMLQLTPVADPGAATSTNNTVTPVEITLNNLSNYPGQLVKIKNLTVAGTGNFAASTSYNISDGTNTAVIRTQYTDLPYIASAIPEGLQDITGVVLMYNTTAQLIPRTINDFSTSVVINPTITVTELTVPEMTAVTGLTDTETVNVSGAALTADILVTIDGADAAMFSVLPASIAQTAGTASGAVTVTYSPTAPGTHTATLKFNSTGATEVTRTLTGTSTMATPVAIDGSGVSQTGFTANWNAVAGATEYELNVYTKQSSSVNASDLFISEYIEGSSNNKAIEIFNGTGADVDLSKYSLKKQSNGADIYKDEYVLTGTLANNDVYVLAHSSANTAIKAVADATTSTSIITFNGNDAVALFKEGVKIDEVGVFNQVAIWGENLTLIRKSSVSAPLSTYNTNEWTTEAQDYATNLGSHTFAGSNVVSTPIAGSPFTVTGETSKAIADLTAGTTYYYTVVAKNGSVATAVSNEVAVTTSTGTGLSNTVKNMNLRAVNGNIVLNAEAGQLVEVYNSIGQKVGSRLTSEGVNTIPARVKGVVFVKIGSEVSKLIME